jgi:N-acetylneuraminic acid mutarotase
MDNWVRKADFPGGIRVGAVGFAIAEKGYVGFGSSYDQMQEYKYDFWEYNPGLNIWAKKADLLNELQSPPEESGRAHALGFAIGNKGYVGTGYSNISYIFSPDKRLPINLKDFWEYDPASDAWLRMDNLPGEGRQSAFGFSIGNKAYIGTGAFKNSCASICSGDIIYKDFFEFSRIPN